MSGPAEDSCSLCLQQHRVGSLDASTTIGQLLHLKSDLANAISQNGSAFTYQMPVFCSVAMIPEHGRRNLVAVSVANLEAWLACTRILLLTAQYCDA